jgi:flavin-binding protein dodecin
MPPARGQDKIACVVRVRLEEGNVGRQGETLRNISGAWMKEQNVMIDNGKITAFRVDLMVTFSLE